MRRGYRDDPLSGDFPDERVFGSQVPIRYVLLPAEERSDALVVAFSAVHPPDRTPRYYNHRLLRAVPCHRLFVLDDRGPREPFARGCWYLGKDRRFDVADSVCDLLDELVGELALDRRRVIACGSSKGAWAAVYFAARGGLGHAVAGEPPTMLGKHLCQVENLSVAHYIAGSSAQAPCEFLDGILFAALGAAAAEGSPTRVHLYCGRGSRYYRRDVVPLIAWLDELGLPSELELGDHDNHVPDLGIHFPPYLARKIAALLDEMRPAPDGAGPLT